MKITYFDGMVTFKSENQLKDILEVAKKNAKALTLFDDNGDLLYSAGVSKSGRGFVNNNGILYSNEPANDGRAKVTVELPTVEDPVEYIADAFGRIISNCEVIDTQIELAANDVAAMKSYVMSMIDVVG